MFYPRHPSASSVSVLLSLASLTLLLPLLVLDGARVFGGTDSLFYALLLKLSGAQFLSGNLWPRWLADANIGMGFPLMYYYPPLPYLLTTVLTLPLRAVGAGLSAQFMAGIVLSQLAAGLAAWIWLKQRFGPRAALLGALFYVLLPYKLVMIYLHMNLAAAWAWAALPLILIACEGMARFPSRAAALFALACAFVGYCHPLTLLVFGPFAAAYALCAGGARVWLPLLAGTVFTALLTLAYTVPFLQAKQWLVMKAFMEGKFDALANLGHIDTLLCAYYLIIAGLVLLLLRRVRRNLRADQRRLAVFWVVAMVLFYALTLSVSAPLWEHIAPLRLLQFPFARLHAVIGVAACWLVAWVVERAGHSSAPPWCRLPVLAAVLLIAYAAAGAQIARVYQQPSSLTADYVAEMQRHNIIPYEGYYTPWGGFSAKLNYTLRQALSQTPTHALSNKQGNAGTAELTCWNPGDICVRASVTGERADLFIRQHYLPAWTAYDGSTPLTITPSGGAGYMRIPLAKGEHEVRVALAPLPWQTLSEIVSLLTLLGCVLLLVRKPLNG